MPNWKKVIISGSDAALNSLYITTNLTASGDVNINGLTAIGTTIQTDTSLVVRGTGTTSATTALLVEDSSGADLLEVNDLGNISIPNGSLSLNGATNTENFNMVGTMFFDGNGTIAAGGVGDSLILQAQSANIAIGSPGAGDITMTGGVTGSFSGSFEGDGTNLTGIVAEWDGSHNGDAEITGSLAVSGSSANLTVTGNVGIGTTSPAQKLHVAGITRFSNAGSNYLEIDGATAGSNLAKISSRFNSMQIVTNTGAGTPHISLLPGTGGNVGIGITNPSAKLDVLGDINITAANISNQVNADVDIGTETVATVPTAAYTAAFFDYVVKGGVNVRAGVVYACHDGTSVEYVETSTLDLGNTFDLQLSVDISGADMRLRATATSNDWSVKTITRAL